MGQKIYHQQKPTFINLNITHRCNFNCVHCPIGQRPIHETENLKPELNLDLLKKHVLHLKKWLKDFVLNISGGEPFLYPHLFKFLKFCTRNNVKVDLITNGNFFSKENIKRISKLKLNNLLVSVDGLEKTHDLIRGQKGSFQKAIKGLKEINNLNNEQILCLVFTIMNHNCNELSEFTEWFSKQEFLHEITFQAISLKDIKNYQKDPLWPKNDFDIEINSLIKMKNKGYPIATSINQFKLMKQYFNDPIRTCKINKNCPVRFTTYFIDADSRILNCPITFGEIGQITGKPNEIWTSTKANIVKKKIKNCKKETCQVYYNCCFEDKTLVKFPKYGIINLQNYNHGIEILNQHEKLHSPKKYQICTDNIKFLARSLNNVIFFLNSELINKDNIRIIRLFQQNNIECSIYTDNKNLKHITKNMVKEGLDKISLNIIFPCMRKKEHIKNKFTLFNDLNQINNYNINSSVNVLLSMNEMNYNYIKEYIVKIKQLKEINKIKIILNLNKEIYHSNIIRTKILNVLKQIYFLNIITNSVQQQKDFIRCLYDDNLNLAEKNKVHDIVFINSKGQICLQNYVLGNMENDFETQWLSEHARSRRRKFDDSDILTSDFVNVPFIFFE